MEDFYDKKYLKITLTILQADLEDLAKWSINNQDQYIEEVMELKKLVKRIEAVMLN